MPLSVHRQLAWNELAHVIQIIFFFHGIRFDANGNNRICLCNVSAPCARAFYSGCELCHVSNKSHTHRRWARFTAENGNANFLHISCRFFLSIFEGIRWLELPPSLALLSARSLESKARGSISFCAVVIVFQFRNASHKLQLAFAFCETVPDGNCSILTCSTASVCQVYPPFRIPNLWYISFVFSFSTQNLCIFTWFVHIYVMVVWYFLYFPSVDHARAYRASESVKWPEWKCSCLLPAKQPEAFHHKSHS